MLANIGEALLLLILFLALLPFGIAIAGLFGVAYTVLLIASVFLRAVDYARRGY